MRGFTLGLSSPVGQSAVLVNFRDCSESLSFILKCSENRQGKLSFLCVFISNVACAHYMVLRKLLCINNTSNFWWANKIS